jgi:hypothetical protein
VVSSEEVAHLAAYATAVLQSSRRHYENDAPVLSITVSVVVVFRKASLHISQSHHAVITFSFFARQLP